MQKRTLGLLIILLLSALYSLYVLHHDTHNSIDENASSALQPLLKARIGNDSTARKIHAKENVPSISGSPHDHSARKNITMNEKKLPIQFQLLAVQPSLLNVNSPQSSSLHNNGKALIDYKGELSEFTAGDFVVIQDIILESIYQDHIKLRYKKALFYKYLAGENLYKVKENTSRSSDILSMNTEEIGTRPKVLDHIVASTPTPYIADGVLVSPGINPALFNQAGFKTDDVLKTVNGLSVTSSDELEQINQLLAESHTLEFQVMRKGRLVTLYLHIPSEALSVGKY